MKKKLLLTVVTAFAGITLVGCSPAFNKAVKEVVVETIENEVKSEIETSEPATTEEIAETGDIPSEEIGESVILEEAEPIVDGEYNEDIISRSVPTDNVKLTIEMGGSTYVSIVNRPDIKVSTTEDDITADVYYVDGVIYSHANAMGIDIWFKVEGESGDYVSNSFPAGSVGIEADKIKEFTYIETVNEDGIDLDVIEVVYDNNGVDQTTTLYIDPTTGYTYKMITDTTEGEGVVYIEKGASFTLPDAGKKAISVPLDKLMSE